MMGQIGTPETSVRNYRYSLRNNPEERSSQTIKCLNNNDIYLFFFNFQALISIKCLMFSINNFLRSGRPSLTAKGTIVK